MPQPVRNAPIHAGQSPACGYHEHPAGATNSAGHPKKQTPQASVPSSLRTVFSNRPANKASKRPYCIRRPSLFPSRCKRRAPSATIGTSGEIARIFSVASIPFITGIRISIRIRSGRSHEGRHRLLPVRHPPKHVFFGQRGFEQFEIGFHILGDQNHFPPSVRRAFRIRAYGRGRTARQTKRKRTPLADLRTHLDPSAESLGDAPADGKPQPRPLHKIVQLFETVENGTFSQDTPSVSVTNSSTNRSATSLEGDPPPIRILIAFERKFAAVNRLRSEEIHTGSHGHSILKPTPSFIFQPVHFLHLLEQSGNSTC